MLPTLAPGDEVVATDSRSPGVGELVVFPHPGRDDFWMIKRVVEPPQQIGKGEIWVLSDNTSATTADSRTLGPIRVDTALCVVTTLDQGSFSEACSLLAGEDQHLADALDRFGHPDFWHRSPGFECLVLLILEQQVSLESGAAMYRRLKQVVRTVDAPDIISLGEAGMRDIGVTRQKARYIVELARRVSDGSFEIEGLQTLGTDAARAKLMALKGIGPWTADAYLLSALRRPDLFPVGDRALQVGMAEVLGLRDIPDEDELEILAEPWRPVRAAAARIVWHSYLTTRGREEPPDPIG